MELRKKVIQKYFEIDDEEALDRVILSKSNAKIYYILFPGEKYRVLNLLHYAEIVSALLLVEEGFNFKFLFLDHYQSHSGILRPKRYVENFKGFVKVFKSLFKNTYPMTQGKLSVLKESDIMDHHSQLGSCIELLDSIKTSEFIEMAKSHDPNRKMFDQFWDAVILESLSHGQHADLVILGKDEKISYHMIKNYTVNKEKKPAILISKFPFLRPSKGAFPPSLRITNDKLYLQEFCDSLTDDEFLTLQDMLQTYFPSEVLNIILTEDERKKYYDFFENCGEKICREPLTRLVLLVIPALAKAYIAEKAILGEASKSYKYSDKEMGAIFSALANPIRVTMFKEMSKRPYSLTELTAVVKTATKKENLQVAHIVPHMKKLVASGLIEKDENNQYTAIFEDISIDLQGAIKK